MKRWRAELATRGFREREQLKASSLLDMWCITRDCLSWRWRENWRWKWKYTLLYKGRARLWYVSRVMEDIKSKSHGWWRERCKSDQNGCKPKQSPDWQHKKKASEKNKSEIFSRWNSWSIYIKGWNISLKDNSVILPKLDLY